MIESQQTALASLMAELAHIPSRLGPPKANTESGTPYRVCGLGYAGSKNARYDALCAEALSQQIRDFVGELDDNVEIVWRRKPVWTVSKNETTLSCRLAVERRQSAA